MNGHESFRVLLIDADPREAASLAEFLAGSASPRFEVEQAADLSRAIKRLAAGGLDAVLVALSLPDSCGLVTFERLYVCASDVPIVVLASRDEEAIAWQAIQSGAQDFLVPSQDTREAMLRSICFAVQRVRARRQMRERAEHLRIVVEQLPCVLWTTDEHLRFTSFAGAELDGLGIKPEQMAGKTVQACFAEGGSGDAVMAAHRQAAAGYSQKLDAYWKGRIYRLRVEPFRSEDGRRMGTVAVAVDVTDQTLIDLELQLTRRIQAGLLPSSFPHIDGFDIAGASLPVAEAGGDYFDYFPVQGGLTGIAIGDVGGHGLGPAIMMSHTRAYLRALALHHEDPGEIVTLVNRFLCGDIQEDRLVTLLFARLDPHRRTLTYASAGQQGYLLPSDGRPRLLKPTGIPLNVLDEAVVSSSENLQLASDDLVVLYTDGVVENPAPDGSQFGVPRMLALLQSSRHKAAREMVDDLFRAVREFSPEQCAADDMTAVVIKSQ